MTITDVLKEFDEKAVKYNLGGKQVVVFKDILIRSIDSAFKATRVEERIGTHVPYTEIEIYLFHERNGRNQVVREQKALEDKFMERSTDGK